jgi:DNA polymerase
MHELACSARTFETWRDAVRPLLAAGKKPDELMGGGSFIPDTLTTANSRGGALRLPRALMSLLENVSCFRDDGRWELMYRLAWRSLYENAHLLEDSADRDVAHALAMDRTVRRDLHKMHAFVRFREVARDGEIASYFAWFEPQHLILRKGAGFFVKRFRNMPWTIATPDGAALWNMRELQFADSVPAGERPRADAHEDLWRTYYRSICNVARINPRAMQREMPQLYWRNLPEASEIDTLMRDGRVRFAQRQKQSDHGHLSAAKSVQKALQAVRLPEEGVQTCRACDLWKHATQAVEGEGPKTAKIMLVGEQPGDEEDLRGAPFVGPAGKVLDEALSQAGVMRSDVYVTNAVKHFKWEPRGKRRLHKKPNTREIRACNMWLVEEIAMLKPRVIVALGASALSALVGAVPSIEKARHAELAHATGTRVIATYHPAAILRADDGRKEEWRQFLISDLQRAAAVAAE